MPTIERPDTTLHFEKEGSGAPVLLIQGVGIAGSGWRPQVEGLAARFECVTFDNRGLGRSVPCTGPVTIETMAADAVALLDALGWPSAHVIGHSMGGVIAQQLALDHPRRVRSLVLMNTLARAADAAKPTPTIVWLGLRARLGTRRMRRRAFLEMIFPQRFLATKDTDALAEELAPLLGRDLADQPAITMRQVRALARHDTRERLGELAGIPTLVFSGTHDPIARADQGRELARRIPGARLVEEPDASHGLPLQLAEKTNEALVAFLSEAEARRAA